MSSRSDSPNKPQVPSQMPPYPPLPTRSEWAPLASRTQASPARRATGASADRAFWLGVFGTTLLLLTWVASLVLAYDPGADTDLSRRFEAPSWQPAPRFQPLGRDHFGRNLLNVLREGTKAFVVPALVASSISVPLALWLTHRSVEKVPTRPWQQGMMLSTGALPGLGWLMLIAVASHQSGVAFGLTLGLLQTPVLAQQLAEPLEQLRLSGVLEGARAHGLQPRYIQAHYLFRLEALPVLCRFIPRLWSMTLLTEAALSYLGEFGAPEAIPSWGRLLRDLAPLLFRAEPGAAVWVALVPLLAIAGSSLALILLGNGLAFRLERRLHAP